MTASEIGDAFAVPFDPSEVKWRPGRVNGNRALALAYVDARCVQDRLDEVLGVCGWQDKYRTAENGTFICELSCKIDGEWITKTDIGGESEQPDAGDRAKAGVSDALKRAAVKFGIGRYLYRLPHQWADYDPAKKQFVKTPAMAQSGIPAAVPAHKSRDIEAMQATLTKIKDQAEQVLERIAEQGCQALAQAWEITPNEIRKLVLPNWDSIKAFAVKADQERGAHAIAG